MNEITSNPGNYTFVVTIKIQTSVIKDILDTYSRNLEKFRGILNELDYFSTL